MLIRRGTVTGVESLDDRDDAPELAGRLASLFTEDIEPTAGLDRTSADARRIVDQWIGRYRESIMEFERRPDESVTAFARRAAGGLRRSIAAPVESAAESSESIPNS